MTSPLADRTYRHLFTAQIIALAGAGLSIVALALPAYDLAGGDAGIVLGTALALKMVAYVASRQSSAVLHIVCRAASC